MIVIIVLFVVAILGGTHYVAYKAGRDSSIAITKEKLKELIMLELKDEKKSSPKRKNTK